MIECQNNKLVFSFPEVHADAKGMIEFQRTLRLPDDEKTYPLPPGLGAFPLKHTDDYKAQLSDDMTKRGGVMLPMYQSEALWIRFQGVQGPQRTGVYPMAVKIAAGKRSAITGAAWVDALKEKDYIVIPVQPWIDGFLLTEGVIRQFVAAPLGMGFTVEEQLTKKAEFGGIQIEVFPMKAEEYEKRFPKRPPSPIRSFASNGGGRLGSAGIPGVYSTSLDSLSSDEASVRGESDEVVGVPSAAADSRSSRRMRSKSVSSMGMAAGGRMKQDIHPDPYGLDVWDLTHKSRTFVHLLNSMAWQQVTGEKPPQLPPNANLYKQYHLPWFEYYSDAGALGATDDTAKIKSVEQMAIEKGFTILPENTSVEIDKTHKIHAPSQHAVKDGEW